MSAMTSSPAPDWPLLSAAALVTRRISDFLDTLSRAMYAGGAAARDQEHRRVPRQLRAGGRAGARLPTRLLRALEYLAARESDPCSEDVVRATARSGRVEVLRWFLEHSDRRGATDKWHVMDWTASRGHLEATQWLWANRAEVCTSLAVIGAARNGRLEMLQWLEQNVPVDDCVWERAVSHAARYGHLQVVQWLYPKQSDRRSSELRLALSFAARRGHEDVVHWLHSQRTLSSHVCSGIYR
ncbi:hypothetical protein PF011_g26993 [Phytophthora fragariae]|uniref:Uncharacterized protein n=2 Tax=Phytophthora fragariae TaxID=53985 RepID=A0A6A3HKR7_9STRA|nr:hypothetical protein PF009_g26816 [Phytophthora fragariae]KAE8968953.1 hypothetical protein PF011_g26993 [Phytophthora fragariae]